MKLKEVAAKTQVQKVVANKPMPVIKNYTDPSSGSVDRITPGSTARITSQNLKIDTSDALQGIFITPTGGGVETKVTTFIDNQPSTLTFVLPVGLPAGAYDLEVRVNRYKSKELRTANLGNVLTVN